MVTVGQQGQLKENLSELHIIVRITGFNTYIIHNIKPRAFFLKAPLGKPQANPSTSLGVTEKMKYQCRSVNVSKLNRTRNATEAESYC